VPLLIQHDVFTVYRKLVDDSSTTKYKGAYRAKLPVQNGADVAWALYDISFEKNSELEPFECKYNLNTNLTESYLFWVLCGLLENNSTSYNYQLPKKSKYKELTFFVSELSRGATIVQLQPYFLKSSRTFGFLLQHRFRLFENQEFDRVSQIESLSLDSSGRPNVFICRDKQIIILNFLTSTLRCLVTNTSLDFTDNLLEVKSEELARKSYLVGRDKIAQSQFMGIKSYGPYRNLDNSNVQFLFVFSERTRSLARDIYLGLNGKLFPAQFSGLQSMFNVALNKNNVSHYVVSQFTKEPIDECRNEIQRVKDLNPNQKVMLIVVLPKGIKNQEGVFDAYGYFKLISLDKEVYCQFVTEDTFYQKHLLKWSVSNIGLQVFSKLGGAPWLVKPAKRDCLILGLGSAHEITDNGIQKWFAYTVCLDSSGDFKYIKPLSSSSDESSYLDGLRKSLRDILNSELGNSYQSFVLHIPFKIKRSEIDAIKCVVTEVKGLGNCEVIVVRINEKHRFLGFSSHNTRVPYESSLVKLSNNMFLMWPEGLQHGNKVLKKRVSDPLLIDFIEPPESWDSKKECIQDILNLTGANWRGFNSKAQPISILYSKLVADFMKEFSHIEGCDDLSIVRAESIAPWFL